MYKKKNLITIQETVMDIFTNVSLHIQKKSLFVILLEKIKET